ncbi:subtilisin-like protein [Ascobolus immersus RN42]|uniref:Subtilisin-like protein n=1 Tax=Ascobolus immersus RN42 TaxID=1160509 RepID=A0A3N4I8S3_ASCIM|nr:subtilisin-like protein [Ascobolus immersus RN42]
MPRSSPDPPSPFEKCHQLQHGTVSPGLYPHETMYRYKDGPPVFAQRQAYDTVWSPPAQNPHKLFAVYVRLKLGLSATDYEDHYIKVFELCRAQEVKGVIGTGITVDMSFHGGGVDEVAYCAVFNPSVGKQVAADSIVERYSPWDPAERRKKCQPYRPVENWSLSAMTKDQWSEEIHAREEQNGFRVRFPGRFQIEELGRGKTLYVVDDLMDGSINIFRSRANGASRVRTIDMHPLSRTVGYQKQHFEHHGEEVAALAAGSERGIAQSCDIVSVAIYPENSQICTPDAPYLAFRRILQDVEEHGLERRCVVNISTEGGTGPADLDFARAIDRHAARGIIVVHCAGNDGEQISQQAPLWPMMSPNCVVVGGMDIDGSYIAESNWAEGDNIVTVVAPAADLEVEWNGYFRRAYGTSFATPLVAAVILCLQDGILEHAEVLARFKEHHTRHATNGIISPILCVA